MTKKHDNVLILKGVTDVKYIDGTSLVTHGQPYDERPRINVQGGIATIVFSSGRKKTKSVAEKFNSLSRNKFASQGESGGAPKELNFMFSLDVDGNTMHFGQGSNFPRNNWWVGFDDGIKVNALSMKTEVGKGFDQVKDKLPEPFNHVANFLGKLFSKDLFEAVNMFEIKK